MKTISISAPKRLPATDFHSAFVVAWAFCLLFYFMEYVVRSAPSVMLPELTSAFGLTTVGLSSLLGLYYYTYALFALIAGRLGRPLGRQVCAGHRRVDPRGRHRDVRRERDLDCRPRAAPAGRRRRVLRSSARFISPPTVFRRGISRPRSG